MTPKNKKPDATSKESALSPEQVMAWLSAHPDFLEQHPDACDLLVPPKDRKGQGLVDFQHYMVQRLKADREDVLNSARDVLETARSNMNNATRLHRATLRLLDAQSFTEFVDIITHDLSPLLDVDITTLVVEADGKGIPHIGTPGLRIVPEGTIDLWMSGKPVVLQSDIGGIEAIFGGGANLVRSQALVRVDITQGTPPALLAFGSRDPALFADGQGTEHVSFLAGVVERLFRLWLQTPTTR